MKIAIPHVGNINRTEALARMLWQQRRVITEVEERKTMREGNPKLVISIDQTDTLRT